MLLWTLDPAERDALLANEATKKLTSNNYVLVEIACTRSSLQLFTVRQAYHARYKKSLEEDVAYHTSGDCRKVLIESDDLFSAYDIIASGHMPQISHFQLIEKYTTGGLYAYIYPLYLSDIGIIYIYIKSQKDSSEICID